MTLKTDKLSLIREFLLTQMNHWALYPIYLSSSIMLRAFWVTDPPHLGAWALMGIVPFVYYLLRICCTRFSVLLLAHITVAALTAFLPAEHISMRVFQVIIGTIYLIYSLYVWGKRESRQDIVFAPLSVVVISFIMLAFENYLGYHEWDSYYILLLPLVLGVYFIVHYIDQYLHFLAVNQSSAGHIPAGNMFRSGIVLTCIYTVIATVSVYLLSNLTGVRQALSLLKKGLFAVIVFLFSLIPTGTEQAVEKPIQNTMPMMEPEPMPEGAESHIFWNILEYVVEAVLLIAVVCVLFRGFIALYRFIRNRMNSLPRAGEYTSEDVVDVREDCDIIREKRSFRIPFFSSDLREQIRHLYRSCVRSHKSRFGDRALTRFTARESASVLERADMALLYEKARYSQDSCEKADVKKMKELCK